MRHLIAGALLTMLSGCASLATLPVTQEAPEGATALCRDGVFSFARTRWETCSQHEGVQAWIKTEPRATFARVESGL